MIQISPAQFSAACSLAALFFATPVMAAKTYAPAQLREMVGAGKYPKQGTPRKQVEKVPFKACVDKVKTTVDAIKDEYPAEVVVIPASWLSRKSGPMMAQ